MTSPIQVHRSLWFYGPRIAPRVILLTGFFLLAATGFLFAPSAEQAHLWLSGHAPGLAMTSLWQTLDRALFTGSGLRLVCLFAMMSSALWIWILFREQWSWVFSLDSNRFSYNHGLWSTNPVWVPWIMIQDVRAHQSLWGRLTRFTHIEVDTGGQMFLCLGVPEAFAADMLTMWGASRTHAMAPILASSAS